MIINKTALDEFREMEKDCDDLVHEEPIERLRFFVSLMCNIHQDTRSWFDIEQFFDECTDELERYKDLDGDIFEKTVNAIGSDVDRQAVLKFMYVYFDLLRKSGRAV